MTEPPLQADIGRSIAGVSSMATRMILAELSRRYAGRSGVAVEIQAMGGVEAARLIREGAATDVVILASNAMAKLEADGHVVAGSAQGFARSGMAVAIRAGDKRPDVGSEEAVRRAVLSARAVCYSTGPSGDHLLQLCARWGVPADTGRLVKAPPGVPVGSLVADGAADLGFQQLSELIHVPGIEVAGPLPPEIQAVTLFSAGVCQRSQQPAETRELIAYLNSPEADEVKRAEGMEPAGPE